MSVTTSQSVDDAWAQSSRLEISRMAYSELIRLREKAEFAFDCGSGLRREAVLQQDRLILAWVNAEVARRQDEH